MEMCHEGGRGNELAQDPDIANVEPSVNTTIVLV
jgi:hypothetical protein